jgi:hypothetical protein
MEDVSMPSASDTPETSEKPAVVTGPATIPLDGLLSMKGTDTCSTCAAHKENSRKYDTYTQELVGSEARKGLEHPEDLEKENLQKYDTHTRELVGSGVYPEDLGGALYPPPKFNTHTKQFVGPDHDEDE